MRSNESIFLEPFSSSALPSATFRTVQAMPCHLKLICVTTSNEVEMENATNMKNTRSELNIRQKF